MTRNQSRSEKKGFIYNLKQIIVLKNLEVQETNSNKRESIEEKI